MIIISKDTIFTFPHTTGWFSTLFLLNVEMCINVAEWEHWVIHLLPMQSGLKSFPSLPRCTFPLPWIYSSQIHQAFRKMNRSTDCLYAENFEIVDGEQVRKYKKATPEEIEKARLCASKSRKWPFHQMKVGDHIFVTDKADHAKASAAYLYTAKKYGMKFKRVTTDNGCLWIWRTE